MDRARRPSDHDYDTTRPAHGGAGRVGGSNSQRTYANVPPPNIETANLSSNHLKDAIASVGAWKPSPSETEFGPLFTLVTALGDSRRAGHDTKLLMKAEAVLNSLLKEMWTACRTDLQKAYSRIGWDADQAMLDMFAERAEVWRSVFTSMELRPYGHNPYVAQAMTVVRGTERALEQARR